MSRPCVMAIQKALILAPNKVNSIALNGLNGNVVANIIKVAMMTVPIKAITVC